MDPLAAFKAAAAAHQAGDLAGAEQGYRRLLIQADHTGALNNLAMVLEATERFDEAGQVYRRAAELAPTQAYHQFALAAHLRTIRAFPEAEAAYRRTLALDPAYGDAAFSLGSVLLATGRFEEGWRRYEQRAMRRRLVETLKVPEWRGEPLAGKRLLVWNEQGYGDQIMMARFLPALAAGEVTYAGPSALRGLFAHLPVTFVADHPLVFEADRYHYWILPLSLPERLGITAQTLPAPPYLFGKARGGAPRIGVVCRGEPKNPNNRFRSLPDAAAARLLALPGAISLEPADTGAADFQDTADIIAGLDLVISVDTSVAHLAGAMGRPVWVLLSKYAVDWQWPRAGTSPWYPSARLFPQARAFDWDPVIDAVCAEALAFGP